MLEAATLERIAALVTAQGMDETTLQTLRADWPELRFTYCSDDDICGPAPYLQAGRFNLYLLDARTLPGIDRRPVCCERGGAGRRGTR